MGELVTCGVVLRETETKESDKILTVLTPDHGRISVIARGARRRTCRFAASCQTLAYSELTLAHRGEWYYLNDGATRALFDGLRADLAALALGFYFAELTETVSSPEIPAPELLSHLLNGLYALDALKKPPELVKPAFELRLMSLAGYEPLADGCAVCGAAEPEDARLDTVEGVVRCGACSGPTPGLRLSPGALAALRHILYGDPGRLYAFRLTDESAHQLYAAAERYVCAQLERGFRTLDYYTSLKKIQYNS